MVGSRTLTALVGLVASVAVSVAVWYYYDSFLLFLVVPFVPILLRRGGGPRTADRESSVCPDCGFRTVDPAYEYCPRDGTRLE